MSIALRDGAGVEASRGVSGTDVVGTLRNGRGPTVMLQADMDALPVADAIGLRCPSKLAKRSSNS